MEALKKNKSIFVWLGLCADHGQTNNRKRSIQRVVKVLPFTIMTLTFWASVGHVIKFFRSDLQSALHATFVAAAIFSLKVPLIKILFLSLDLSPVFADIQNFCDRNPSTFFEQAEKSSRKFTKILVVYFVPYFFISNICVSIVPLLLVFAKKGHVDEDDLIVQYQLLLPWHQDTQLGWIFASIYSNLAATTYFFVNSAVLSFFIGITLYFQAFHQHFECLLKQINQHRNAVHSRNTLCQAIHFEIFVKK